MKNLSPETYSRRLRFDSENLLVERRKPIAQFEMGVLYLTLAGVFGLLFGLWLSI